MLLKLLVISHHLAFSQYQIRWKKIAKDYNVQVKVLIPRLWRSSYYQGGEEVIETKPFVDGNYEVLPVETTCDHQWWKYKIIGLKEILKEYKPDVVFAINDEFMSVVRQCIFLKYRLKNSFNLMFFSTHACLTYRNETRFLRKYYYYLQWVFASFGTDAILCHHPKQEEIFRKLGRKKTVSVQTQVGIDTDVFYPNDEFRKEIRDKYNWNEKIIGFAGRMIREKGIFTLFDALKDENVKIVYLGSGPDVEKLKDHIDNTPHSCRVEFISKVHALDVPKYMNAFDLFYTGSLTLKNWDDTFPNAVAQAEACKVPVVVSDSCALPFLAGEKALIFPEGDDKKLHDCVMSVIDNDAKLKELGEYGFDRCKNMFCVDALNKMFYELMMSFYNKG